MNRLITFSRSKFIERRNFEKSDVPFDFYLDTTKKKGAIFLVNKHSDPEFLFITDGKLKIHLDNESFCAQKGDIVVINPNVLHNIIPITEKVPSWLFELNSIIFYPQCLVTNNLFSVSILLSFSEFHLNGIIQYVFFGIMPLRSIHTVLCINSSFVLMAK